MSNKPWLTSEEVFIENNYNRLTARQIADMLGRTESSVVSRIHLMRSDGRLNKYKTSRSIKYVSYMRTCCECGMPRATCDDWDVCKVCRDKARLADHLEKMYQAYDNLPDEIRRRTSGDFTLRRNKRLMSKSIGLARPTTPNLEGLDPYYVEARMDRYYRELEGYELAVLRLDIDVVKQRRTKWERKTKKYLATH